jgi:hypothetical protein
MITLPQTMAFVAREPHYQKPAPGLVSQITNPTKFGASGIQELLRQYLPQPDGLNSTRRARAGSRENVS